MPELSEDKIIDDIDLTIGDTVMTCKTGLPGMGIVVGILTGPSLEKNMMTVLKL